MRARAQRCARSVWPLGLLAMVAMLAMLALLACEPPERRGARSVAKGAEPGEAAEAGPAAGGAKRQATIPAKGWNQDIAWRGLEEGLQEAKRTGMPMMMVVHTEWCGNCQKLKATFNQNGQLERLSERFVMVHMNQDEHPEATLYGPDGQYIPRVMFLDSEGNIDKRLQNPNRPSRYRYFYTPQEDLVATMREALDQHGNKS